MAANSLVLFYDLGNLLFLETNNLDLLIFKDEPFLSKR